MSNYEKYLIYKNKYLKLKEQLGSASVNKNNIKLGGKSYYLDVDYFLARSGKIPTNVDVYAPLDSLVSEDIDSLGFSNKYPEYFFEFTNYIKDDFPLADIYKLKIHKIKENLKYPLEKGVFKLTKYELDKYQIDTNLKVTNNKYKNIFQNHIFKVLNVIGDYYVVELQKIN